MSSYDDPKSHTSIPINLHCSKSYKIDKKSKKLNEAVAALHATMNGMGRQVRLIFTFEKEASQILRKVSQRKVMNNFA